MGWLDPNPNPDPALTLTRYMSSLEEVALRTLASYGLPGERMEGLTGK